VALSIEGRFIAIVLKHDRSGTGILTVLWWQSIAAGQRLRQRLQCLRCFRARGLSSYKFLKQRTSLGYIDARQLHCHAN
jgi:hypothetical protein